ncbi:DUF748 domain-containing protein [Sulfurimonas aquatica]|uniref:DUF748 domain-containing protein n=1 Tax=Sulfurimonas aquatica TaxID=2672570 RepID=A0A975B2I7_9BACT|nr:DUF748 domain-containing protein [Sulfurimonas aquatica]QSZ42955.1 DUF748 domain-containing protein [Sulfurimonas aquatica]
MYKKIILYTLLFYTLFGFVALPYILKSQIISNTNKALNAKIEIDSVYFNPFIFKLELSGVALKDLENNSLVTFDSLLLNVEVYSLLRAAIHLKNLTLTSPQISLVHERDNSINLLKILKEKKSQDETVPQESQLPRVIIDAMEIVEGSVKYVDYTKKEPFEFSFDDIGFRLKDVDTDDVNTSEAKLRFYSHLGDGGFIDFKSRVVGFEPFVVEGSLDFEASKLYTQWKYFKDILNLEVADGKISFSSNYHFDLDEINATKIDAINISLEKLRIKPKNKDQDILNLKSFYLRDATLLPFQKSLHIKNMGIAELDIKSKRNKNKSIDWLGYIQVEGGDNNSTDKNGTKKEQTNWSVRVEDVALEKIRVSFDDRAISPNVKSEINELNIFAQDITLLGEKPFSYQMNILLNDRMRCSVDGDIRHKQIDIDTNISCKEFDVIHYRPYIDELAKESLALYDLKLQKSLFGVDAKVNIIDIENEIFAKVKDTNITLEAFEASKRSGAKKLVSFKELKISGINLDMQSRKILIDATELKNLEVDVKKFKNGRLNLENLLVAKKEKVKKIKAAKTKQELPYEVNLKKFTLSQAKVDFRDYSLEKEAQNTLDKINLNAYNIDIKEKSWLEYDLLARVNKKGYINADGKLRHTPLKQRGKFQIKNLPLKSITPYLQESTYLEIESGKLSLKGTTQYAKSSSSADLRVKSSLNLSSLFVNDTKKDALLLSLNDVDVKSFTFEMFPNRLYVDEIDVDSFYLNAKIDKNKVINFSELSKTTKIEKEDKPEVRNESNSSKESSFPIKIAKVNVSLGSAEFADYSIPIKFHTHIHDLNGVIYSISNTPGETSYVDISGEVDRYGSTKLEGSLDASDPKAYTDINFNFKNLDLNSLSGYSASFAGHEIDSGKLYLDLGYKMLNSDLEGSNKIIIKNIELGDEVEDENITVLPLGFVIALLEDNDGVIDIDMPVEGNVDEPDFKYGELVFKTVVGVITKAVTAPFKFLGALMGIDADSLEFLEFEASKSMIEATEREKLDQIYTMMMKRPKISLKVTPAYDASSDLRALREEKLSKLVMQKSDIKNINENVSAQSIEILEDIYEESKDDDKLDELKESLRDKYEDDEIKREYHTRLLKLCREIQPVTIEEMSALAESRAEAIVSYLTQEKSISVARISKSKVVTVDDSEENIVKVKMEIEVK